MLARSFRMLSRTVLISFASLLVVSASAIAATLPTGFTETRIASGISNPTAMTVAADGRIFVAEQAGRLRVIRDGVLLAQPFLQLSPNALGERGLLGVALDPNFTSNGFVYVLYTSPTAPPRINRVSRFTASATNPDVAEAGSEVRLLDLSALSTAYIHNGGALHFGADGMLYIATGDNADSTNAQSLSNTHGKILRIRPDGSIPDDNPFLGQTTGVNQSIWALGLRNPYTFAPDPATGRIHINDVGQDSSEEVNQGIAGANFGWPQTEGYEPGGVAGVRYPIYAYQNAGANCSIIGAAFYRSSARNFPDEYEGRYFFGDYCGGFIRTLAGPTYATAQTFATGVGSLVDIDVGGDGALYYLQRNAGGELFRVTYSGAVPPSISAHPDSLTVPAGQSASFSVVASGSSPLSYQWLRNGVDIVGATDSTYALSPVAPADNGALFSVRVSNAYGSVVSNQATLSVTTNSAPVATITLPVTGTLYRGGDIVPFAGTATDAEDGALPASAFRWRVDFHHDDHTHPHMLDNLGSMRGQFYTADRGETSVNVFYRVILTVTDSSGATDTTYVDVLPRTSTVTLTSDLPQAQLTLDGVAVTLPHTFVGVEGIVRSIGAVTPITVGAETYDFASWSDNGPIVHEIDTPIEDTTYTAYYDSRFPGTLFEDNFDTALGWVRTPNGVNSATTGLFQRGDPQPTYQNGVNLQPDTCYGGVGNCMVTGLLASVNAGVNDIDNGLASMQSPAIQLPASGGIQLTFRFYLGHIDTASSADYFRVRVVGTNGIPVTVFQWPASSSNTPALWRTQTVNLTRFAGQTITLRFEAADSVSNGGTVIEAGFDEVVVTRN